MLLVGFGYFKCNIMYEYLLKQMSPNQGDMCLNCHNNKNNNTSMSQCTDTLSFITNKYIYSLSVLVLLQKSNNFNHCMFAGSQEALSAIVIQNSENFTKSNNRQFCSFPENYIFTWTIFKALVFSTTWQTKYKIIGFVKSTKFSLIINDGIYLPFWLYLSCGDVRRNVTDWHGGIGAKRLANMSPISNIVFSCHMLY